MKQGLKFIFCICFVVVTIIPAVSAGCTCEAEDEATDKGGALKYQIAAIPSVLLAGVLGVLFPVLGKAVPALQPETQFFFIIKAFAAGVILSTGFIHVLPEAFEKLTSPYLKNDVWCDFPFTGFIAMLSAIGTLSVDAFATSYFRKAHFGKSIQTAGGHGEEHSGHVHIHTHATHGHSQGAVPIDHVDAEAQSMTLLLRNRVIAQVLELGIIVHSVIIGITLGASQSPKAVKPLFAALMFHQCFEGMGLGGCIAQAKFKWSAVTVMTLFFSVTTPVGIAIGMIISSKYSETNPTALIVQGILNATSAGILIYMSLVDFLAADFMHPKMQNNCRLQVMAHFSLLLGAGLMSGLAKWA